jgi:hypothetical protein
VTCRHALALSRRGGLVLRLRLETVSLFDQGLTQVLQASVTGLEPRKAYVLALSGRADGSGPLEGLSNFMTNPRGAAIVNAVGPIRQIVESTHTDERRYLVIASSGGGGPGEVLQVQVAD